MTAMRCCTRYIFRQTFWPLVFVTVTMAGVVWLTQSLNFLDLVINRNLPVGIFLSLSILALPMMMSVLLPIAMFAAVTFTFTKLTIDSELVILRASGISQPALARPALALAGLVTLLCYALTLYLMPLAHRNFRDLKFAIRGNYSYIMLREGVFNTIMDGLTVYVRARDSNGELLGILVHDSRTPGKPVTVMAERGALVQTAEGPRVVMVNGNRQVVERKRGQLSLLNFDRYTFDLGAVTKARETRWRKPRERYLHELLLPDDSREDRRNAAKLKAEGHQRLVSPLLALAFTLIGLATLLSGEFNRRGQVKRVLTAVCLVVVVQSASLGLHYLAASIPAVVPLMYLNPLAVIAVAYYVLAHHRRHGKPALLSNLSVRV